MESILEFFRSETSPVLQALYAGLFTWILTAFGAGLVFFFKSSNRKILDAAHGFTGGVMIAASFWSLIAPAIHAVEVQNELGQSSSPSFLRPDIGFFLCALFMFILDKTIPHLHIFGKMKEAEGPKTDLKKTSLLVLAIAIHNIPEGLAVGVAFGALVIPEFANVYTLGAAVALGIGGANFFHDAFVKLDKKALQSDTMVKVFDQMRIMRGFVDKNFSGRDWNLATAMVMNGEAAFQIMGDWAKGEFLAAGKVPGKDFLCASTPGEGFLYNVDSFAMFKVKGSERQDGQKLLAKLIVGKNFQKVFNLNKGSIPARTDVSLNEFDHCAHVSAADMNASSVGGTLLPSYAHGMALRGAQAGAITDTVTAHFNSKMSSKDAVAMLVKAIDNSK